MAEKNETKEKIVDAISQLNVLELSELVKMLEEKFNVSAAMPLMTAGAQQSQQGAASSAQEEKTEFTVMLANAGTNKIPVIKVIREITGLGLKESKDLVDGAPKPVKEGIQKTEAEEIKKKLIDLGAVVELK